MLRDVPPGPQHLAVRCVGYVPRTLHAFVPPAGELQISLWLHAAPLALRAPQVRPTVAVRGLESGAGRLP